MRYLTSIARLMILIIFIGLSIAAARSGSPAWADSMFTLAVTLTIAAVIWCVGAPRRARSPLAGFAIATGGYLFLAFGPWCSTQVRPHLLSTKMLNNLYGQISGKTAPVQDDSIPVLFLLEKFRNLSIVTADDPAIAGSLPGYEAHQRCGHSIVALIVGGLGFALAGLANASGKARKKSG